MSLFTIVLRSIQQRGVASALTILSMSLGVMMVVAVLTIHGVVEQSFRSNASLGYNMIVGAKGGEEQLVLNTVYYLSKPVENVSYRYYLEFLNKAQRDSDLTNSFAYHASEARQMTAELAGAAVGDGLAAAAFVTVERASAAQELRPLELNRNGKYGPICDLVVPVCLGDYFDRFRVVGTTPDFFDKIIYDMEAEKGYEFAQGRNFTAAGYYEAVVGSAVAREKNVNPGDQISPRHGTPDGHEHEQKFTVVGILKSTGTPNDRAVFVNMEGFYLMDDHAKPVEEEKVAGAPQEKQAAEGAVEHEPHAEHEPAPGETRQPLALEQREITALLVRTNNPLVAPGLKNAVNEGSFGQAVFPVAVIYGLFEGIINPIRTAFIWLTSLICIVSGLSILVSIYNSMNDRRHEIAVMRALGADRVAVMSIILLESMFLALAGGFLGWLVGHGVCVALSPEVEARTGVSIGFLNFEPKMQPLTVLGMGGEWAESITMPLEWAIIPALLLLAVAVGFYPALQAYRTDVAKSLGK